MRRAPPWDCGFPLQTPRMQDTAEGFGQPIRQVFEPFFRIERELPSPFDTAPRYRVKVEDHFWHWLYLPIARAAGDPRALIAHAPAGAHLGVPDLQLLTLLALLFFVRAT